MSEENKNDEKKKIKKLSESELKKIKGGGGGGDGGGGGGDIGYGPDKDVPTGYSGWDSVSNSNDSGGHEGGP